MGLGLDLSVAQRNTLFAIKKYVKIQNKVVYQLLDFFFFF